MKELPLMINAELDSQVDTMENFGKKAEETNAAQQARADKANDIANRPKSNRGCGGCTIM